MDIQEQFDRIAVQYDSQRRALIPCFDDFYGIAIENLVIGTEQPEILDLGAGTGLFAGRALEKYPDARLTLVDMSGQMLDVARKRFEGLPDIRIEQCDFTCFPIEPDRYDAVISSLAIHHLDDEEKQLLYRNIFAGLKKGGIFINAEQMEAETPALRELYHRRWSERIERSGLSRAELDAAYKRVGLDRRSPLAAQVEWLEDAGFESVDVPFKYYDFAVICAYTQQPGR